MCAAAVVGVLLAGVAAAPAYAEEVGLTGTVTDLATGDPVAGACVTAVNYSSGAEVSQVCTGADGAYALTVPTDGAYKVRATADTYHELWAYNRVSFESAGAVYISTTSPAQPVDFRLFHQTASVSGRITDSTGAPVDQADVRVVPEDSWDDYSSPYDYSDADGRYTVTGVIPGRYRVSFWSNPLGQVYAQGSESREGATIFEIGDGASLTVNDSFLPLGTVEVTVVDAATGAPMTQACLSAESGPEESVCDAADGVYRMTGVWPGYRNFHVGVSTHLPASVALEVVRGETVRARVELTRAEAIITRVLDWRTSRPVESVCAIVARVGGHGLNANQPRHCAGTDGRLIVPLHGQPGTYQLFIESRDGYGAQWVGVGRGTGNRDQARSITVAAGANVTIPPIHLDRAGTITGVARKPDGTPATNVCALPYAPDAYGLWRETPACTNAQGRYTISGLGPYDWPVLFMGDSWIWSGNKPHRHAATKVPVNTGRTSTMNAVVPAGAVITGQVRDTAGEVVNADVRAYSAVTGDYAGSPSGAYFGQPFQLRRLVPQQVRVEYMVVSGEYPICWYNGTTNPALASPVQVTAGATIPLDLTGCG